VDSLDRALKATGIVLSVIAGLALIAMFAALVSDTFGAF
jgi:hypothetical protein